MLPLHLVSTYASYKRRQERISTWLGETAISTGYTFSAHSSPASTRSSEGTVRLKGRARKVQRQEEKDAKEAKDARQTMTLRVSDLLPIATHIQKTKSAVIVPQHIVRYVQKAIVACRSCADWFAKSTSHEDCRESNAHHEYMINVLENVLKILSPLALPRKERSPSKRSAVNVVEISNMFQDLDVDETEDSDLNLDEYEPMTRQATAQPVRIILETDESEVEQEFLLAVYCFAKTMNELREYVISLWLAYIEEKEALVTVAPVCNTAMALIRRTEQEFETVKRPSKYPQDEFPLSRMLGILYHSHGLRASCNLDQVLDPHHTAPICGCSATHFCFYISYVSLAVFQAEMKSRGSDDPDTSEPKSFHGLINKFQYEDATSEDCEKVDCYCKRSGKNFFTLAILMLDDLSVRRCRDKTKPTAANATCAGRSRTSCLPGDCPCG